MVSGNIYLCNLHDIANPIELAFMPKYGNIVKYKWFGDGYIMLGFSSGYLNAVRPIKRSSCAHQNCR